MTTAREEVVFTPGLALVQYEVAFTSGLQVCTQNAFQRVGARPLDMSRYPATLFGLSRTVEFVVTIDKDLLPASVQVKLFNLTDLEDVTGTNLTHVNTTAVEYTSGALTVGSAVGDIRDNHVAMYQAYLQMNGGTPGADQVYCNDAKIRITYA
jgi:hypothetical protein